MTHRLWALSAILLACLLPVRGAVGQEKVDLGSYFLPNDEVGDFHVFRSENDDTYVEDLLVKETVGKKGKKVRYVFRSSVGEEENWSELFLVPGKRLLRSDYTIGEYDVDLGAPKTVLPLQLVPGRSFRYVQKGALRYLGIRIGSVKIRGEVRFLGFETHATPAFERDDAAVFERIETVTMKPRGAPGPIFTTLYASHTWITPDLGTMGWIEASEAYADGDLLDELPPTEWWFESGVLAGEPVPAPPP
jgi:hypothetical protein